VQGAGQVSVWGGLSNGWGRKTAVIFEVSKWGNLLVDGNWYEGNQDKLISLIGAGNVTFINGNIAPYHGNKPAIVLKRFTGSLTFINQYLAAGSIMIVRPTRLTNALFMGIRASQLSFWNAEPGGNVALTGAFRSGFGGGDLPYTVHDNPPGEFLRKMLVRARRYDSSLDTSSPAGVSDVHLERLQLLGGLSGIHVSSKQQKLRGFLK
jgi:hypothetical protein